jgi:hypothetical protein
MTWANMQCSFLAFRAKIVEAEVEVGCSDKFALRLQVSLSFDFPLSADNLKKPAREYSRGRWKC